MRRIQNRSSPLRSPLQSPLQGWVLSARIVFVLFISLACLIPLWGLLQIGLIQSELVSIGHDDFFASFAVLDQSYIQWRLVWTLAQALITCVIASAIGLPIAWVLARYSFSGRAWLLRALFLPIVTPMIVLALALRHGVGAWLELPSEGSAVLMLWGNLFFNLPIVIRAAYEGFSRIPPSVVDTAKTLGASTWSIFWRVECPQIKHWMGAANVLIFLYCVSSFGCALLLGGTQYATIEVEIYTLIAQQLLIGDALVLALVLMALLLIALIIGRHFYTPQLTLEMADRAIPQPIQGLSAHLQFTLSLLTLLIVLGLPLLTVIWHGLMMKDWINLLWGARLALYNSLFVLALVLAGAVVVGSIPLLMAKPQHRLLSLVIALPLMIPVVILGFGYLLSYPQWSSSRGLIVVVMVFMSYPIITTSLLPALANLPKDLIEGAQTLGARPLSIFQGIYRPLLKAPLRRGMALVAASSMGEFTSNLVLSRPETMTLPNLLYQYLGRPGQSNLEAAWGLSLFLLILSVVIFVVIEPKDNLTQSRF